MEAKVSVVFQSSSVWFTLEKSVVAKPVTTDMSNNRALESEDQRTTQYSSP